MLIGNFSQNSVSFHQRLFRQIICFLLLSVGVHNGEKFEPARKKLYQRIRLHYLQLSKGTALQSSSADRENAPNPHFPVIMTRLSSTLQLGAKGEQALVSSFIPLPAQA
jgi:hypothetical protein